MRSAAAHTTMSQSQTWKDLTVTPTVTLVPPKDWSLALIGNALSTPGADFRYPITSERIPGTLLKSLPLIVKEVAYCRGSYNAESFPFRWLRCNPAVDFYASLKCPEKCLAGIWIRSREDLFNLLFLPL